MDARNELEFVRRAFHAGETVFCHQTFAAYPRRKHDLDAVTAGSDNRIDCEWLVGKHHAGTPILLVYDYTSVAKSAVHSSCVKWWESDRLEMQRFLHKHGNDDRRSEDDGDWFSPRLDCALPKDQTFASADFNEVHGNAFTCIKVARPYRVDGGGKVQFRLELVSVLPRQYGLRLGQTFKTNGKSANQLNALRACSGSIVQVNDANMDQWIGESLKIPAVTRLFFSEKLMLEQKRDAADRDVAVTAKALSTVGGGRTASQFGDDDGEVDDGDDDNDNGSIPLPNSKSTSDNNSNNNAATADREQRNMHRKVPQMRILGFREHVFSFSESNVGRSMADSEFVFGTFFHRCLNFPLNARFHYG
jgi:hypothetical protein